MTSITAQFKRWGPWIAKCAIVALLVFFVHRTIDRAVEELDEHHWSLADLRVGWLLTSGLLYLLSTLPCALFWRQVLWTLGQQPGRLEAIRAYFIGHLGKYVPGKALVVVLRVGLIRSPRTDAAVATMSVFFETLTMMAIGSVVGAALLAVTLRHQHWLMALALVMLVIAGIPTWPPVFRWLVRRVAGRRVSAEALERLGQLDYRRLASGWLGVAGGWFVGGLSLAAAARAGGFGAGWPTVDEVLLDTAAVSLSVVAGFLSLIPGGALVREIVILALIAPFYTEAGGLVSAVLFRLVSVVAELLISAILYGIVRPNDAPVADG